MEEDNQKLYNPDWDKHGYIQVYTGNGKGKTTASLGLAMRALGRNWKVLLIMFTKGGNKYGELNSFRNLSENINQNLTIFQAGTEHIIYSDNITEEDKEIDKLDFNSKDIPFQAEPKDVKVLRQSHRRL